MHFGTRTFKSDRLEEGAIQLAFCEGSRSGNQDIVGIYYEHPAITSKRYADGLYTSWNWGKPDQVFAFLLSKLTKETWRASKKDMHMSALQSSFKSLPKHSELLHLLNQDIIV